MKNLLITLILVIPLHGQYDVNRWGCDPMGEDNVEVCKDCSGGGGEVSDHICLMPGGRSCRYTVGGMGDGTISFWIFDEGACTDITNPGYTTRGPMWGLEDGLGQRIMAGICRASFAAGCQGYSLFSTTNVYTYGWLGDGLRGAQGIPWSGGWYRWTIETGMDQAVFTVHDVDYDSIMGPGIAPAHGDVSYTVNAESWGGAWESFSWGSWSGFVVEADGYNDVEKVCAYLDCGTGIFASIGECGSQAVGRQYEKTDWAAVKKLFR